MPRPYAVLAATALLALLASCGEKASSEKASATTQAAAPAAQPSPADDVHRFTVGELQAIALRDGSGAVPNDNKVFAVGRTPQDVATVLSAAGVPTDTLALSIQALLVRSGDQLVLLDTGGGAAYPGAGKLPASLQAAGITPDQITDIVLSHTHGDHIGGLVTADDALAFPNAKIHLAAAEYADLRDTPEQKGLVRVIQAQVYAAEPGKEIAPGLKTFAIRGHTPGHIGVEITSGDARMIAIGDTAHHYVVSLARPEWTVQFDGDAPTAQASRRALMQRAVDEKLRVFAPHFPFPGVGTVRREGEGFAWTPAS